MGIKYYYSVPQQIRSAYVISNAEGKTLYVFDDTTFVRNVPRITICSILDGTKLSFGYCTCATKDQYIKKRGQQIAKARALQKPFKTVEITDMKEIHDISDAIIDEIFNEETKRIYGVCTK